MEYNIYDLMEGFADDTIALSQSGAADLRRIEELTMNKIKEQNEGRRVKKPVRRVTRMVLVAAIVAALCAVRLCPAAADYLFLSHDSCEPGYRLAAAELGMTPCLRLGMRLGEGSGCPLLFRVLEAACGVMRGMATFAEAAIQDDYLDEIRAVDAFTVEGA